MAKGSVDVVKDNPWISQVITTTKGEKLIVPQLLGSSTKIKPLANGMYEISSKGTRYDSEWQTKILSEDEIVAKYGEKVGKNMQVIG